MHELLNVSTTGFESIQVELTDQGTTNGDSPLQVSEHLLQCIGGDLLFHLHSFPSILSTFLLSQPRHLAVEGPRGIPFNRYPARRCLLSVHTSGPSYPLRPHSRILFASTLIEEQYHWLLSYPVRFLSSQSVSIRFVAGAFITRSSPRTTLSNVDM